MDFEKMKAIVEKAKNDTLVEIDHSEPMLSLVMLNNEGVNHGVMQMYYKILGALYEAETERLQAETAEIIRRVTA